MLLCIIIKITYQYKSVAYLLAHTKERYGYSNSNRTRIRYNDLLNIILKWLYGAIFEYLIQELQLKLV